MLMTDELKKSMAHLMNVRGEYLEAGKKGRMSERANLFEKWCAAEREHNLLVSNTTAAAVENPISRAELVSKLEVTINSRLDFGEAMVRSLETEQSSGGSFTRYSVRTRDAAANYRTISENAFDRAMKVLEEYCPRRPDSLNLCPPWKLELSEGNGFIAA